MAIKRRCSSAMSPRIRYAFLLVAALSVAGSAAGCGLITTGCDADLGMRVSPTEKTLAVGESFTATLQFLGCGGTRSLRDVIIWSATDTAVVRVDSQSGLVTGRRAGQTQVIGSGKTYGTGAYIPVTVR
jgi:hypothetical protein